MYRRLRRLPGASTPATVAVLLLTLAGCDGSTVGTSAEPSGSTAPDARPETLEGLAEAVGCGEPEEAGKTLDYRQGTCESDGAEYVLLTFDATKGQREWLDVAQMYGGVYLVGDRWVLSAEPRSAMESARGRLGGTIEESGGYSSSP